jgi:hypothetical protein
MAKSYFFIAASRPFIVADDALIVNHREVLIKFPIDWQALLASHGIENGFWTAEMGGEEADTLAFEGTSEQAEALACHFIANNASAVRVLPMDWTPETVRPLGQIINFSWEEEFIKL